MPSKRLQNSSISATIDSFTIGDIISSQIGTNKRNTERLILYNHAALNINICGNMSCEKVTANFAKLDQIRIT